MTHSNQAGLKQRTASDKAALDPEHKLAQRSELVKGSTLYPIRLCQLRDAPHKLYALGNVQALSKPAIAIVGARKATPYGLECAKRFGKLAAKQGVVVVSGGAIGCDMAAHQGALEGGGSTVVVLGSGADVAYPMRARGLFLDILEAEGLLLSEAPWGTAPQAWAFSKRNRVIAALAGATLIVEAGLPSGTFQTADHTLSLGNEVLVVPGPIFSKESRGSNQLLTQGALPVVDDESFIDALVQLFGERCKAGARKQEALLKEETEPPCNASCNNPYPQATEDQLSLNLEDSAGHRSPQEILEQRLTAHVITSLEANPMTMDALAASTKASLIEVVRMVSMLEIDGSIERLRDGRYITKQ